MHPILFKIGPITVYSYGFMVAIGFIIAAFLAARRAKGLNIPEEKITTLALLILLSGIIGARVFYVLMYLDEYVSNPLEILMVTHGGLIFYGGAIFAFLAGVCYIKLSKLPFLDTADLISVYAALGHAIGRIGCFLNGCCYGMPVSGSFGVIFQDGVIRFPTQLLSFLYLFSVYIFLRLFLKHKHFSGQVLFLYLCLYSAGRFFVEFLRADSPPVIYGFTISQVISLIIFGCGIIGYVIRKWTKKRYV